MLRWQAAVNPPSRSPTSSQDFFPEAVACGIVVLSVHAALADWDWRACRQLGWAGLKKVQFVAVLVHHLGCWWVSRSRLTFTTPRLLLVLSHAGHTFLVVITHCLLGIRSFLAEFTNSRRLIWPARRHYPSCGGAWCEPDLRHASVAFLSVAIEVCVGRCRDFRCTNRRLDA